HEFVRVCVDCDAAHWKEGAMIPARAKGHQWPSIETEGGEPVADAFLGFWHCGPDGLPKPLKYGALVIAQRCQIFVDVLDLDSGFGLHDLCSVRYQLMSDVQSVQRPGFSRGGSLCRQANVGCKRGRRQSHVPGEAYPFAILSRSRTCSNDCWSPTFARQSQIWCVARQVLLLVLGRTWETRRLASRSPGIRLAPHVLWPSHAPPRASCFSHSSAHFRRSPLPRV